MTETTVRKAKKSDLPEIVAIAENAFPQDFDFGEGFDAHKCEKMFRNALADPNEFITVIEVCIHDRNTHDDIMAVVGFAYYVNKPPTNGTVTLEMLGVQETLRDHGLGFMLLDESDRLVVRYIKTKCEVPNLATIHLTVSKDNPAGQRLYIKAGYKHAGDIPGLVGEGNTELVMLKTVDAVRYRTGLWENKKN